MDRITLDYSIDNAISNGSIKELKTIAYREIKHTAYPTFCEYTEYVPVTSIQEVVSEIGSYTVATTSWQISTIANQVTTFSFSNNNFSILPQNTTTSIYSTEEE